VRKYCIVLNVSKSVDIKSGTCVLLRDSD